MAEIEPLRALHYDLDRTGGLQPVIAPPYDVIDPAQRQRLIDGSPYNVVTIDLPQAPDGPDAEFDMYEQSAETLQDWRQQGIVVQDDTPAIWALEQDYTGPDGKQRTRRGFLARVRVTEYGAGKVRPHERTHPGPKEDRLRLTRATQANLSPIFALYSDPEQQAWAALEAARDAKPWGTATDADGTVNRLWRVTDEAAIQTVKDATAEAELLIADGHHRYETARVYAEEIGEQDGPHRYLLTCLVALEDPGLTVFPTHRLVKDLSQEQREALRDTLTQDFELHQLERPEQLPPPAPSGDTVQLGYMDKGHRTPYRATLSNQQAMDAKHPDRSQAYRTLDTAVVETLILKGALGYTDENIDHLDGLGYARSDAEALQLIADATFEAGFFTAPVPVAKIQEIAAAGETMPPKSTYFFPKVPTGLLFNLLTGE